MSFRSSRFTDRYAPLLFLGALAFFAANLSAQALFVKPVKVLGDPNFIGTAANPTIFDSPGPNVVEGREMQSPEGVALDTSVSPPILYVADTGNNRVLAFKYSSQLTPGSYADLILGQPDRFTTTAGGSSGTPSTGLHLPTGLAVDSSGNLYVADTGNNRIVRYPAPFSQPPGYQFPDLLIGQTSFTATGANTGGVSGSTVSFYSGSFAGRTGITFDSSGNLWVADIGNNRVLRFPASVLTAKQFGPTADLVVGQPDMVTVTASTGRTTKSGLSGPTDVAFDSAGDLLISDQLARVLVYLPGITAGAAAYRILGVDPSVSYPDSIQINTSQGVTGAGGSIVVADNTDNRVMVFPPVSSWSLESQQFSPTSTEVIGQQNINATTANQGGGVASAATLSSPASVVGTTTELYVADASNNRVLVYPITSSGIATSASRVVGQLDFPYNAPNLVEGKEFNTVSSASGVSGSAIIDYGSTPPHLYVADAGNNRILGYNDFTRVQTGQPADLVIGQPDLLHTEVNYPSGLASQPSAQGLNGPTAMAVDSSGNLYVVDTLNSRVVRFPAPFASGVMAQENADLVLGQPDFVSLITDTTQTTLSLPTSVAFSADGANTALPNSGWLAVTDAEQNRVLFFQKPFSQGMAASKVLGQPSFTSTAASSTPSGLYSPQSVAIDSNDNVIVADAGNERLQVYPPVASISAFSSSAAFSLTAGLTQPISIGMGPDGKFWVADPQASPPHLVHFTSVAQLPLVQYAPDATLATNNPVAVAVDQYDNILVADGINRILYFVPQIAAQNAANYLDSSVRPLAPGAFAAIYPAVNTNVISSGTQVNNTLPWPTVTSDTEVMVGGIPAPLYFVSPGQINFPMPMELPTGGSVDLQVIRPSTGQIYGAAEIPMAVSSPALFVAGSQQSGQVAALNQDNTINSATNPAARGTVIQLFGTGQGPVTGAPPDGTAPTGPVPTATNPQVLLGPVGSNAYVPAANVQYSGLAPDEVGVWQINVLIPATAPTGNVPISLFLNSIPSTYPSSPTEIQTTIAIN